jgi:O-antigen ligase
VLGLGVAVGAVVVLSQSRTGLLVFLTVLGIQALRIAGAWGIVAGCVLGPPMLLLGGRSGVEAEESADERAEILREAFEMLRRTKGLGPGAGQFSDTSSIGMTAHNAYVLAAAETGLVGLLLFSVALYLSLKVPVAVWLRGRRGGAADLAPAVGTALAGALVGILFLSWTYKDVLYMMMGASAALYSAARARDPGLRVGLSLREAAGCALAALGLLAVVYVGTRLYR